HVLGRGGERHVERRGELPDGALPAGEPAQHGAPRGIAEGAEHHAHRVARIVNHTAECTPTRPIVNLMVEIRRCSGWCAMGVWRLMAGRAASAPLDFARDDGGRILTAAASVSVGTTPLPTGTDRCPHVTSRSSAR